MKTLRFKAFMRERNLLSMNGEESLLSVSEYYGVKPREEIKDDDEFISRAESLEGYRIVKKGDLVMNYMLAWKGAYGISKYEGIVSPAYAVFYIDETVANLNYIHYKLRTDEFKVLFRSRSKGIIESRLRLYPEIFLSLQASLPPLAIQERIASFLDGETARIDALIEKKKRLVELLEEKRKAEVMNVLTKGLNNSAEVTPSNFSWIGNYPKHWKMFRLRHLVNINTGNKDTENKKDSGNFPFFVRSPIVEKIDSYSYDGEAVLTAGDGVGVGKVFHYINGKFDFHQRVYAFTNFKYVTGKYFYHYLSTFFHYQMTQHSAKSTVDSVRLHFLQNFVLVVPPHNEQIDIVEYMNNLSEKFKNLTSQILLSIKKLEEYRTALITEAVTGQIEI